MDERASYRFAVRPLWILSHLLVIFLVVLFVNLGFWQLRRLDQRKDFNAQVAANAQAAPEPLPADLSPDEVDALEWRRFVVDGRYRDDSDVLVANRSQDMQPGYWVVTLLEREEGGPPVAVVRGFVLRALVGEGDTESVAARSGPVTVTGYAQGSRSGGRFATSLPEGATPEVTRVDLGKLGEEWGTELAPVWLQLSDQDPPPDSSLVTPVPLPDLEDGPHLSYAIQWFIFATIGAVGYVLILRRNAQASSASPDRDE